MHFDAHVHSFLLMKNIRLTKKITHYTHTQFNKQAPIDVMHYFKWV